MQNDDDLNLHFNIFWKFKPLVKIVIPFEISIHHHACLSMTDIAPSRCKCGDGKSVSLRKGVPQTE